MVRSAIIYAPHRSFLTRCRLVITLNKEVLLLRQETGKVIIDPGGRYAIVSILIQGSILCIASIYGPNDDNPSFVHNFFTSIYAHSNTALITGGDFYLVQNSDTDRLSTAGTLRGWRPLIFLNE